MADLHEFGGAFSRRVRGRLADLHRAGYIPANVYIDERVRRRVDWIDAEGRKCHASPYATCQWEVGIRRLAHERDALIEREHAKWWAQSGQVLRERRQWMRLVLAQVEAIDRAAAAEVHRRRRGEA